MRVIAGSARGRSLVAPRGTVTRPIADRVKETLFAILGDRVPDAVALDLYAGSGAIGIEALSRGASHCDFVEQDRRALAALRENLERAGVGDRASVHPFDVGRYLELRAPDRCDLAVLDPPYETRAILAPLEQVAARLAPGGVVVVKHHWRTNVPAVSGLTLWRQRRFGETALSFLRTSDEADGANGVEEP